MAKLSFMKFYPADWINDTRELSPEAKGCWIDILCLMWNAPERGVWKGTHQELARATGIPWESMPAIVTELARKVTTATFDGAETTLINRRMQREQKEHDFKLNRDARYRERHKNDAKTTPKTLDVRRQTPQDVRQTTTSTPAAPPQAEATAPAPNFVAPINPRVKNLLEGLVKPIAPKSEPRAPAPYKPPETPLQKFLVGIKILQGFEATNREWDATYFKRYGRAGSDMLKFFEGDWRSALQCAEEIIKEMESKSLSWTVETLVKHAPHWKNKGGVR